MLMPGRQNSLRAAAMAALSVLFAAPSLRADGLMIIPGPPGPAAVQNPFPLEVKYHRVTVDIAGQVAKTRVEQEFFNPTSYRL